MTISTTASSVRVQGNGAQTVFSYSFPIPSGAGYTLYLADQFGNITTLDPSVYSINGVGSANGGSFTYPLSGTPVPAGEWLVLARGVPDQQNTALGNQGPYLPQVVELALDWLEMQIQQNSNELTQTLRAPAADVAMNTLPMAVARANQYLAFGANGQPIVTTGPSTGAAVSAAMTPVVEAATLDAGRVAFGASAVGDVVFTAPDKVTARSALGSGFWTGVSAPIPVTLGETWLDTSTTPNTLRIYDGSAWVAQAWLDVTNGLWQPYPAGNMATVGTATLDHTYAGRTVFDNAAGITITLPAANAVRANDEITFIHQQSGTLTLQANGTDHLMGPDGWNATSLALSETGDAVTFRSDGTGHWYQTGKAAPAIVNSTPVGASAYAVSTTSISCTSGTFTASSNGTLIVLGNITASTGLNTTSFTASLGAWTGTGGFNAASTGSGTNRQIGWLTMTKGQSTTVTISGTTSTTFMEADLRMFFLPAE